MTYREKVQAKLDTLKHQFPEKTTGWELDLTPRNTYRIICNGEFPLLPYAVSYREMVAMLDTVYFLRRFEEKKEASAE